MSIKKRPRTIPNIEQEMKRRVRQMRKFKDQTERAVYDYMCCHTTTEEASVWSYILRLRSIKPLDELICEDIDAHINAYVTGSMKAKNEKCHSAYSCALKHLKKYMQYKGLV
jgi:hypothetical protein